MTITNILELPGGYKEANCYYTKLVNNFYSYSYFGTSLTEAKKLDANIVSLNKILTLCLKDNAHTSVMYVVIYHVKTRKR